MTRNIENRPTSCSSLRRQATSSLSFMMHLAEQLCRGVSDTALPVIHLPLKFLGQTLMRELECCAEHASLRQCRMRGLHKRLLA